MTVAHHRQKTGKLILIANFSVFILVFILFALKGFTSEELTEILKYLVPIKSVYMTALVKYVISTKEVDETVDKREKKELTPLYTLLSSFLIWSHILLLSSSIVFCAINLISFNVFINAVLIIETFFGAYVGYLISDMFKIEGG